MLSSMARHLSHLLAPSLHPRSFLPLPPPSQPILVFYLSLHCFTNSKRSSHTSNPALILTQVLEATLSLVYSAISVHLIICFLPTHLSIQMSTYPSHQHLCPALTPPLVFWLRLWSLSRTARSTPLSLSSPPQSHRQLFALISAAHSQKCSTC